MTQTTEENNKYKSISLRSLIIILQKEYKIILLIASFLSIIGFFYSLTIPKEYIATAKIMPEISYKPSNGMGGLNELLKKYNGNVDLYNTEITNPELYAEILKTSDFYEYILNKEVVTIANEKMQLKSYYNLNFETDKLFSHSKKSDLKTNSKMKHYSIVQDIQKRITLTTVKKNNLIFVTAKMQDPVVAAAMANATITYLIDYISKYRTEKARQELRFIENLQKNVSGDSSKNDGINKELEHSLSASIIQLKVKIQEDTPIIQVLEKAQIPVMSSEPSRSQVLIIFALMGLLIGVVISFLKNYSYKTLWAEIID